jgi:hypothetical protein
MPAVSTVPTKIAGDVFTATMWNTYIRDNVNKLGIQMHRQLSVAAFLALTGLEDGDEVYVEVDATNGIAWHLRYDLTSTKWRFLGGPPLSALVATDEASAANSSVFVDITTAGPSVTVPLAGNYTLNFGMHTYNTASAGNVGMCSPGLAGVAGTDANAAGSSGGGTASTTYVRVCRAGSQVTALAATNVVKLQYRTPGGGSTQHFSNRELLVWPTRVG